MTAMQSNSSVRNNPFLKNLRFKIRDNRLFFLLNALLQIVGAAISVSAFLLTSAAENKYYLDEKVEFTAIESFWWNNGAAISILGLVMLGIGLLFIFPIAFNCFDYLYKKQRVDMILSLPITSNQRFWSDYLTGLGMSLLPTVVSILLATLIALIGLPSITDDWANILGMLLPLALPILLGAISLYSFAVLAACCCGNNPEGIFAMVGMISLPPIFFAMLWLMFESQMNYYYEALEFLYFLKYSGPIGAVFMFAEYIDEVDFGNGIMTSLLLWTVQYLIGTVLLVLGTWRLYINRKAEDVSKPFVYRFMYHTLLAFCVIGAYIALFALDFTDDLLIPIAIFGTIPYLLIEIAINRGIKKLYIGALRYVVTSVLSIALIFGCLETGGFGLMYYTPNVSSVRSIECEIPRFDNAGYYVHLFNVTDKEAIETITEVYDAASKRDSNRSIQAWQEGSEELPLRSDETYTFFDITYKTKIGMMLNRRCSALTKDEIRKLAEIQLKPEFFRQIVEDRTGIEYLEDDSSRHCNIIWSTDSITKHMSGYIYKEMCELYISDSEALTVDIVTNETPFAWVDDMPLYEGIHDTVWEYIERTCGLSWNTSEVMPSSPQGAPLILSADSPWLDPTLLQKRAYGLGSILKDASVTEDTAYEGVTVGYTPQMLSGIRYNSSPLAEPGDWVIYLDGKCYPVIQEDCARVAALAENGIQLTVGMYLDAEDTDMFFINSPNHVLPEIGISSIQTYAQDGTFDTYLSLYPHKRSELASYIDSTLLRYGVSTEERNAFLQEYLDVTL